MFITFDVWELSNKPRKSAGSERGGGQLGRHLPQTCTFLGRLHMSHLSPAAELRNVQNEHVHWLLSGEPALPVVLAAPTLDGLKANRILLCKQIQYIHVE